MQTEAKPREKTVKKFIQVAEQLKELNNFNGVMEVIGGLNLWPVQRLKQTWEEVGSMRQSIEKLDSLMENKKKLLSVQSCLKISKNSYLTISWCLSSRSFVY